MWPVISLIFALGFLATAGWILTTKVAYLGDTNTPSVMVFVLLAVVAALVALLLSIRERRQGSSGATCSHCQGSGENPGNPDKPCPKCHGRGMRGG